MNPHEKMRRRLEKIARERKSAEYKAGESARRSQAARLAAAVRRDARDDLIVRGLAMPRNAREDELQCRALYGDDDLP